MTDDRTLFEYMILEGAQAGLSWTTILNKRDGYREAYDNFDVRRVAAFDEAKIQELLANPGIVRNKLKVRASVHTANAVIAIQEEHGSLYNYLWSFMPSKKPIVNRIAPEDPGPTTNEVSDAIANDLKTTHGVKFFGSTICYAFMQATGMVLEHSPKCFRFKELGGDKL